MSQPGVVETLLGGLDSGVRRALVEVFRYLVPNHRLGPIDHGRKLENFRGYYLQSTTPASTGEFSIVHGMGEAPYLIVPVLPVDVAGAKLVPLEVSRAADRMRIYLKSSVVSAPFTIWAE